MATRRFTMFATKGRLTVALLVVGVLVVGVVATNVYSQNTGDRRRVAEWGYTLHSSTSSSHYKSCNACSTGTISGTSWTNVYKRYYRYRYEYFTRDGVWLTTGYSEWTYYGRFTSQTGIYWGTCDNLSCRKAPPTV